MRKNFLVFILLTILLQSILIGIGLSRGWPYIGSGPSAQIARAARSLVHTASLEAPEFREVHEILMKTSSSTGRVYWQDLYALGRNGALYPKHSLLSVFMSVPFYALFGDFGFLVLQQALVFLMLVSCYCLVRLAAPKARPIPVLAVLFAFTQLPYHLYAFSPEIHATALTVSGFALSCTHPLLGSVVFSLPLFAKPSHALLLPFLVLAGATMPPREGRLSPVFLGSALVVGLFLLSNWALFGSPFWTSYHRLPIYSAGVMHMDRLPLGFDLSVFSKDWSSKLFDSDIGLIRYNLLLLVLPLMVLVRKVIPRWAAILQCGALLTVLYIFSYPYWDSTSEGSRYLTVAVALSLPATFTLLSALLESLGKKYGFTDVIN